MEMNVLESVVVSEVAIQSESDSLRELNDLQLTLVGGGIADVVAG